MHSLKCTVSFHLTYHLLSRALLNCHLLSLVVIRPHSLYHTLSLIVIRCTTHCHLLSLDVPVVCLFINDRAQRINYYYKYTWMCSLKEVL